MYSPPYNRIEDRAELLAFLRANSFAVLVTRELRASHLPVQVRETESELILDMHMARANPQWQDFFDDEVLVVFSGPHAYVSPRWYEEQERVRPGKHDQRSEEHTSELQSQSNLVCRLLLEKKKEIERPRLISIEP